MAPASVAQLIETWFQEPKGHRFESQLGHTPRLWFSPQLEHEQQATDQCFSPLLSPSVSLPLSKIKKHILG